MNNSSSEPYLDTTQLSEKAKYFYSGAIIDILQKVEKTVSLYRNPENDEVCHAVDNDVDKSLIISNKIKIDRCYMDPTRNLIGRPFVENVIEFLMAFGISNVEANVIVNRWVETSKTDNVETNT